MANIFSVKLFGLLALCCLPFVGTVHAQGLTSQHLTTDSLGKPSFAGPRVSYGLSAGAAFSSWGSASYLEPRVQYNLTPRFQAFGSLMMVQNWGGRTFTAPTTEGTSTIMTASPNRQYLLHVGGTYAMTTRLLLSGSVWKDLSPASNRWQPNPYYRFGYPEQGFHFQAQYQVTPNITVSGGVRYSSGGNPYGFGYPGSYGGGFYGGPWGF